MIQITRELVAAIEAHAERDYPAEACGLLLGVAAKGEPRIARVLAAANREGADRERRYQIDRAAYEEAERTAAEQRIEILGVYHSHPDSPPVPSARDGEFAFPEWLYWIAPVVRGAADPSRVWRRGSDMDSWEEIEIRIDG